MKTFRVRITKALWDYSTALLLKRKDVETKGFFLCSVVESLESDCFVPKSYIEAPTWAYEKRTRTLVVIDRKFIHELLTRCADEDLSLLEIHTHPWTDNVCFSSIDLSSDPKKFAATEQMSPPFRHATLVIGQDQSVDGHLWDYESHQLVTLDRLTIVQSPLISQSGHRAKILSDLDTANFQKQILMFGEAGQRKLAGARIGLIGCGGLGSQIAQALALLGVTQFVLVDSDTLEVSNGNRVVGVLPSDIESKALKVHAVADGMRRCTGRQLRIDSVDCKVQSVDACQHLFGCDVLVGAVDSPSARQFLNRLSASAVIPYIDGGVGIRSDGSGLIEAGGQSHVYVPGITPCRECIATGASEEALEQESAIEYQRSRSGGYVVGADIPNPQVVFLNGIIGNLIAWEVVKLLTGCSRSMQYLYYDLLQGSLFEPTGIAVRKDCLMCSPQGYLAAGSRDIIDLIRRWELTSAFMGGKRG